MSIKQLKKKIKSFFTYKGKKVNKSINRKFQLLFRNFFTYNEFDSKIYNLGITNFEVRKLKNNYIIDITLKRPGLLIGKGGSTYDNLIKYLNKHYPNTKLNIIGSKLYI